MGDITEMVFTLVVVPKPDHDPEQVFTDILDAFNLRTNHNEFLEDAQPYTPDGFAVGARVDQATWETVPGEASYKLVLPVSVDFDGPPDVEGLQAFLERVALASGAIGRERRGLLRFDE